MEFFIGCYIFAIVYNNLENIFRGCPTFLFSIKCGQRYCW